MTNDPLKLADSPVVIKALFKYLDVTQEFYLQVGCGLNRVHIGQIIWWPASIDATEMKFADAERWARFVARNTAAVAVSIVRSAP